MDLTLTKVWVSRLMLALQLAASGGSFGLVWRAGQISATRVNGQVTHSASNPNWSVGGRSSSFGLLPRSSRFSLYAQIPQTLGWTVAAVESLLSLCADSTDTRLVGTTWCDLVAQNVARSSSNLSRSQQPPFSW